MKGRERERGRKATVSEDARVDEERAHKIGVMGGATGPVNLQYSDRTKRT